MFQPSEAILSHFTNAGELTVLTARESLPTVTDGRIKLALRSLGAVLIGQLAT